MIKAHFFKKNCQKASLSNQLNGLDYLVLLKSLELTILDVKGEKN